MTLHELSEALEAAYQAKDYEKFDNIWNAIGRLLDYGEVTQVI